MHMSKDTQIKFGLLALTIFLSMNIHAQVYEDYIGGGNSQGINVITSDNFSANG